MANFLFFILRDSAKCLIFTSEIFALINVYDNIITDGKMKQILTKILMQCHICNLFIQNFFK